MISRRRALGAAVALATTARARPGRAGEPEPLAYDPETDLRNLRLVDGVEAGRRFVVLAPRYAEPDEELPVVVLLHGLGETGDPRAGAYAWLERYGLGLAWQRLVRAPVARAGKRGEWTDARLAEVNAALAARPFRGFVMVCPHMPNPSGPAEVESYASWVTGPLLARARAEVPQASKRRDQTLLAGVSLGGWVSLEVLVRGTDTFGAWAGVQTAIGTWAAEGFADKLAHAAQKPRAMLVLTSTQDHWRASSEALAAALRARGLPCEDRVIPGPHDQPWLREAGTIETLLWLDRHADAARRAGRGFPTRDTVRDLRR